MRRITLAVAIRDSQQHDEAPCDPADDAPADANFCTADALNNGTHTCVIYIEPDARASRMLK